MLRFECEPEDVEAIRDAIAAVGPLRGEALPTEGDGDIHGSVHATLVGSDEKVEIPNVPGE